STVSRFRFPRGLRARLTLWIAVILILVVAASFAAIYRGTGQQLRNELDRDLVAQAGAFAAALPSGDEGNGELADAINRYGTHQPFRSTSQLLYAGLPGNKFVTNEPDLLGVESSLDTEPESLPTRQSEARAAHKLRTAPEGFTTIDAVDVGGLRVYVRKVTRGDH